MPDDDKKLPVLKGEFGRVEDYKSGQGRCYPPAGYEVHDEKPVVCVIGGEGFGKSEAVRRMVKLMKEKGIKATEVHAIPRIEMPLISPSDSLMKDLIMENFEKFDKGCSKPPVWPVLPYRPDRTYGTVEVDKREHKAMEHMSEDDFRKMLSDYEPYGISEENLIEHLVEMGWKIGKCEDGSNEYWREQDIWTGDDVFKNLIQAGQLNVRDFPGLFPKAPRRMRNRLKRKRRKVKRARRNLKRFDD